MTFNSGNEQFEKWWAEFGANLILTPKEKSPQVTETYEYINKLAMFNAYIMGAMHMKAASINGSNLKSAS